MLYPRIQIVRGGIELAALMTLVWLFYPVVMPRHVATLNEAGMCISAANHNLWLKEVRSQEKGNPSSLVVEDLSDSYRMLEVLLEGTGSSNGFGLYYLNIKNKLYVWSRLSVKDC